MSAPHGALGNT